MTVTAAPATSSQLETDAAAKLKAREDAVAKREAAVTTAEQTPAAKRFGQGTWTVGTDIEPGTYKTAEALTCSCYWAITRTGSNGGDIIENDSVDGGFPMVTLTKGQTFESSRCGDWVKQ